MPLERKAGHLGEPIAVEPQDVDVALDKIPHVEEPLLPAMLDVFSAEVIPLLRRRGLFRTAYEGATLREHYGLAWPQSAFPESPTLNGRPSLAGRSGRILARVPYSYPDREG
jgi:hypothetical protein